MSKAKQEPKGEFTSPVGLTTKISEITSVSDAGSARLQAACSTAKPPMPQLSSAKLKEMSASSGIYADYLKFQGRVYKQSAAVAVEFFAQKPEAQFIANARQWNSAGYKIKDGGEAIHFADEGGNVSNLYDFSQVEGEIAPAIWTINKDNAAEIKSALNIPKDNSLIGGIIAKTADNTQITACMEKLGVPPRLFDKFSKSYMGAVQTIIAGRLEIGGNRFNITPDATVYNALLHDTGSRLSVIMKLQSWRKRSKNSMRNCRVLHNKKMLPPIPKKSI